MAAVWVVAVVNYKQVVECNQVDTIAVFGTVAVKTAVVVVASVVVDSRIEVAHNWFAAAEVASVVDIGVEVVRIVATAEMTPRQYFVVAIVAVDIPGLVVVASFTPYQRDTIHFQFSVYIYITQPSIVSNYLRIMEGGLPKAHLFYPERGEKCTPGVNYIPGAVYLAITTRLYR